MKKLLSLLSVLTISESAVPTTIAASPYQKENNKLSEKIKLELNDLCKNNKNWSSLCSKIKNNPKKRIKRMGQIININQYIPRQISVYIPREIAVNNNPPEPNAVKELARLRIKEQSGIDIPIYSINLSYLSRSGVTIKINYFDSNNNITYSGLQYTVFSSIN